MGFLMKGFDEEVKRTARLTYAYNDAIKKTCNDMAHFLKKRASDNTPKVTGNLRRGWEKTPAKVTDDKVSCMVYNNVEYGADVEYGHRIIDRNGEYHGTIAGQYFLERSKTQLRRASKDFLRDMSQRIENEVNR